MRPTSTRYHTHLERTQARQRTFRESKQRIVAFKKKLAHAIRFCKHTYCKDEAMPLSPYCGRHAEDHEGDKPSQHVLYRKMDGACV